MSIGTRSTWTRIVGVTAAAVGMGMGPHPPVATASAARVVVSDALLGFSPRPIRTQSRVHVVEVFNPGPTPIRMRVRVRGEGFRLATIATTCRRTAVLQAGEQCAVGVRFDPLTTGPHRGTVVLSTAAGRVAGSVGLRGAARGGEAPLIFVVAVRPSRIRFGGQSVGTRSAPRVVTVSNPVAHVVEISRVVLSGAFPGNFRIGRQTCVGTLAPGRSCTIRVRFTPRFVSVRTASLVIVVRSPHVNLAVALSGRGASSIPSAPNLPLTLAAVDRTCFYAPSSPGVWPVAPISRPHSIRGGFDDPRASDMAHFGVDVSSHNEAAGLALRAGTVGGFAAIGSVDDEHFELASSDGVSRYFYYHVHPSVSEGARVVAGQVIGHVDRALRHVFIAEIVSGCGLVDPRRPTGILRDPADTEAPRIGPLAAYRATAAAYRPFRLDRAPGRDPAAVEALDDLHGLVDLRARVWDLPRHETLQWPQQPLMVAGVRSFLAPIGRPGRHFGMVIQAFDGSRFIDPTRVYRVFAHGTYRLNGCFYSARPCVTVLRLHVAADGFDSREFANGNYLYCVSALTIRGRVARRCTPVTIHN